MFKNYARIALEQPEYTPYEFQGSPRPLVTGHQRHVLHHERFPLTAEMTRSLDLANDQYGCVLSGETEGCFHQR